MVNIYEMTSEITLFDYETDESVNILKGDIITVLKHYEKSGKVLVGFQGCLYFQYWNSLEDKIRSVR
jgi:hypothetical protein